MEFFDSWRDLAVIFALTIVGCVLMSGYVIFSVMP